VEVSSFERHENKAYFISLLFRIPDQANRLMAGQCRFVSEVKVFRQAVLKQGKHPTPCCKRNCFRVPAVYRTRNDIRVDELPGSTTRL
jgi:hypothetical protein